MSHLCCNLRNKLYNQNSSNSNLSKHRFLFVFLVSALSFERAMRNRCDRQTEWQHDCHMPCGSAHRGIINNTGLTWDRLQGLVCTVRTELATERSVQRKSLFLLCRTSLLRLLCSPDTKQDCYPLFTKRCSLQSRAEHVVSCSWHSK